MLSEYPDMVIEDVGVNSITKNKNLNLNVLMLDAGAIESEKNDDGDEEEISYETIIETTSKGFLRTNLNIPSTKRTDEDSDEDSYILGLLATKIIDDEKSSKLIIYADEMFTEISIQNYLIQAGNNQDVIANSIAYLNQKEDTITIRKNYDTVTYNVTQAQHNIIIRIIWITPFAIMWAGIIVWLVRRKKK